MPHTEEQAHGGQIARGMIAFPGGFHIQHEPFGCMRVGVHTKSGCDLGDNQAEMTRSVFQINWKNRHSTQYRD
jgi:hypothetical protein